MTPFEGMAAIRLALGAGWVVHHHAVRGEYEARRGDFAVFGRSPGRVVDLAAGLVTKRVRATEPFPPAPPRTLTVPVTMPEPVHFIPTNVVVEPGGAGGPK